MHKNTKIPKHDSNPDSSKLFETIFNNILKTRFGLEKQDLEEFYKALNYEDIFPVSILRTQELSSFEAILKYLRENKNYSYNKIAILLKRNPKTLAVTYNISRRKKLNAYDNSIEFEKIQIPFSAFHLDLSILESICSYLKSTGRSYVEIARLISRDPRTVWTVCKRAERRSQEKNNQLIKLLNSVNPDFSEAFNNYLQEKYYLNENDLEQLSRQKKESPENIIPVSVFRFTKISGLESIVKYLRENKRLSYKKISFLLNRNPKTLAVSYNVSRKKFPAMYPEEILLENCKIPFSAFDNDLSILESICSYLKSTGRSYVEIARLISRDPRTVWTVCKRAEKKLVKNEY